MQDASLSFSISSFIVLLPGRKGGGHWIGPAVGTTCKLELTLSTSQGSEQDGPHQLIFSNPHLREMRGPVETSMGATSGLRNLQASRKGYGLFLDWGAGALAPLLA